MKQCMDQNYFPKRFPAQHQDCQPCELVPAYVHLASGDSSYVNGQGRDDHRELRGRSHDKMEQNEM